MHAAVPRLGNLTTCVAPKQNRLPVVGQTPFGAPGSAPQDTPTPLAPLDDKRPPIPLQVYKSKRAFFGSAPVGALDLLFSKYDCTSWFLAALRAVDVMCVCLYARISGCSVSYWSSPWSVASASALLVMVHSFPRWNQESSAPLVYAAGQLGNCVQVPRLETTNLAGMRNFRRQDCQGKTRWLPAQGLGYLPPPLSGGTAGAALAHHSVTSCKQPQMLQISAKCMFIAPKASCNIDGSAA